MKLTFKSDVVWERHPAMRARTGGHEVIMDEPVSVGGTDQGPNPIQFLLSSLGGCFISMGRMVAKEMDLCIKSIRCQVEGDLDKDGLSAKNPAIRPGLLAIRMKLHAETGESPEKMAEWLKQVEDRCPVKNCLVVPVPIIVTTV